MGDLMAALVGISYGSIKIGKKSLEGGWQRGGGTFRIDLQAVSVMRMVYGVVEREKKKNTKGHSVVVPVIMCLSSSTTCSNRFSTLFVTIALTCLPHESRSNLRIHSVTPSPTPVPSCSQLLFC